MQVFDPSAAARGHRLRRRQAAIAPCGRGIYRGLASLEQLMAPAPAFPAFDGALTNSR